MTQPDLLTFLYVVAVAAVLGLYIIYIQLVSLRWDQREIRILERLELHLAQILPLLEAPDVKALMAVPESRRQLFLDFSADLKDDVWGLLRDRRMGVATLLLVGAFFASYHLFRAKAALVCGPRDLQFLSGLELALLRRLEKVEL